MNKADGYPISWEENPRLQGIWLCLWGDSLSEIISVQRRISQKTRELNGPEMILCNQSLKKSRVCSDL